MSLEQVRPASHKKTGGGEGRLPLDPRIRSDERYGSETVVPSPSALMVNTPVAVFAAYTYVVQPDGGLGTDAMNGPATWPWPLVTCCVRAARPASPLRGPTPTWAP